MKTVAEELNSEENYKTNSRRNLDSESKILKIVIPTEIGTPFKLRLLASAVVTGHLLRSNQVCHALQ